MKMKEKQAEKLVEEGAEEAEAAAALQEDNEVPLSLKAGGALSGHLNPNPALVAIRAGEQGQVYSGLSPNVSPATKPYPQPSPHVYSAPSSATTATIGAVGTSVVSIGRGGGALGYNGGDITGKTPPRLRRRRNPRMQAPRPDEDPESSNRL